MTAQTPAGVEGRDSAGWIKSLLEASATLVLFSILEAIARKVGWYSSSPDPVTASIAFVALVRGNEAYRRARAQAPQ